MAEKLLSLEPNPNRQNRHPPAALPEYTVIPDMRTVCVKFGKRVTEREIAWYARSLRMDPAFNPEFSEIVDLREVEELELRGEEMMELAEKIDPFSHDAKRAFVVRDSVQKHAAHMHQILRLAKENLSIFYSIEDAEQWIRLKGLKP